MGLGFFITELDLNVTTCPPITGLIALLLLRISPAVPISFSIFSKVSLEIEPPLALVSCAYTISF